MEEINSLRQQLSAAEFLVNSLRAQLVKAEEHYAAAQRFHHHHVPRTASVPERAEVRDGRQSNIDPNLQSGLDGPTNAGTNGENEEDASMGMDDEDEDADGHPDRDVEGTPPGVTGTGEYPIPDGMVLPVLDVKTIFPSLADVKAAVEAHALAQGWTAATKKRDRIRICMGCRTTPTCRYHCRAETCAEGARISAYKAHHDCIGAIAPGSVPKRHHVARMRFLRQEVPKLIHLDKKTPTKDIQEAVFQRFGTLVSLAQCSKLRGPSRSKRPAVQGCSNCGEQGHNKLTCKADDPQPPAG